MNEPIGIVLEIDAHIGAAQILDLSLRDLDLELPVSLRKLDILVR